MRQRIANLRKGLVEALTPYGLAERFAHIAEQRGMFSYTGLTAAQVRRFFAPSIRCIWSKAVAPASPGWMPSDWTHWRAPSPA
ncbi:hypothetical protein SSTU70S_02805 [Stutzerimonas stutzeri]